MKRAILLASLLAAALAACSENPQVPVINGVPIFSGGWGGMAM